MGCGAGFVLPRRHPLSLGVRGGRTCQSIHSGFPHIDGRGAHRVAGPGIQETFSGFVYLSPPDPEKLAHFPPRARFLGIVPPALLRFGLRWLNYLTRLCDGWLSTRFSQYGWGVVFQKSMEPVQMVELECDVNVCFRCGTGHPNSTLASVVSRKLLWRTFSCSVCAEKNLYFDPLRMVSSKPSQAVKR